VSDPWSNDFPSTFDVGTPGAAHIHFANDGSLTLYAADGTTVLATLNTGGLEVFGPNGNIQLTPSLVGPPALDFSIPAGLPPGAGSAGTFAQVSGGRGFFTIDGFGPQAGSLQFDGGDNINPGKAKLQASSTALVITNNLPAGGPGSGASFTFTYHDSVFSALSLTLDENGLTFSGAGDIILQSGRIHFADNVFFAGASPGANGALPATVGGYIRFYVGGTAVKIPFYF